MTFLTWHVLQRANVVPQKNILFTQLEIKLIGYIRIISLQYHFYPD